MPGPISTGERGSELIQKATDFAEDCTAEVERRVKVS